MVAHRIYYIYMVQARKETHDHVSVRVKCLNYTCPNEFSVVGINKAIYKEHLNTGDCGRIGSHLLILYAHLLLISSMILRYVNLVMTICSQKSFTLNHHLSAVEKYLRKSYSKLSPIHGLGSATVRHSYNEIL